MNKFLGKPLQNLKVAENDWAGSVAYLDNLDYSHNQQQLEGFSIWLNGFIASEKFIAAAAQFIELQHKYNNENEFEKRSRLSDQISLLQSNF